MESSLKEAIWRQFGAALDMLRNTVRACPDDLWSDRGREPQYWYLVFHTLFWTDLYLSGSVEGFTPPPPFTLEELDPAGRIPAETYKKETLLNYLDACYKKCRKIISGLTPGTSAKLHTFRWGSVTFAELLLYNLRHVQHHAAQLNLLLRQKTDSATGWIGQTKPPLL